MAASRNVRASGRPVSRDPLLNFKFLVRWDGKIVAGVSKVGALTRTTEAKPFNEGGAPQITRKIPWQTTYGDVTLERGLIVDTAFEQWASKVWSAGSGLFGQQVSLEGFRKDITIQVCNQAGQVVKQYSVFKCWPTEYQGMPDLDASSSSVAIESITLANEGWQRDDVAVPEPPEFSEPPPAPKIKAAS